ncbi:hypothetical protein [Aquimarina rubra]|uniref:Uncharacterized protein n=1 Tax=Aquimarina rubra TaxID=1920033 RepID=A0ABW5L8D6_9FLAO
MQTGKIQISDKRKIAKILNRSNSLLIIIGIVFLIIDYDLFSSHPIILVTEGYLWKGLAIVFQLVFVGNLINWELKKQRIINILSNGIITLVELKMSERVKPNDTSSFYIHLFEYSVSNNKYEVTLKNKKDIVKSNYIIYQTDNPKNGIVYEDLKEGIKKLIKTQLGTK